MNIHTVNTFHPHICRHIQHYLATHSSWGHSPSFVCLVSRTSVIGCLRKLITLHRWRKDDFYKSFWHWLLFFLKKNTHNQPHPLFVPSAPLSLFFPFFLLLNDGGEEKHRGLKALVCSRESATTISVIKNGDYLTSVAAAAVGGCLPQTEWCAKYICFLRCPESLTRLMLACVGMFSFHTRGNSVKTPKPPVKEKQRGAVCWGETCQQPVKTGLLSPRPGSFQRSTSNLAPLPLIIRLPFWWSLIMCNMCSTSCNLRVKVFCWSGTLRSFYSHSLSFPLKCLFSF